MFQASSSATLHFLAHHASSSSSRGRLLLPALSSQLRLQSSWSAGGRKTPPQRRRYQVDLAHRPHQANGAAVPFHVKELPLTKNKAAATASQAPRSAGGPQLAPPKQYDSDLIVVLDMDECLVHSQFLSSPQAAKEYAHQLLQHQKTLNNSTSTTSSMVDSFRFALPNDGDLVHVHVRPGLQDFLSKVTARFETHIFTAAVDLYANPLLDVIDPNRQLAGRWFRESCVFDAQQRAYVKNLAPFGPSLERVVLVDNNPLSFLHNPENGILVSSFYNDATDTTLESVYQLLEELDASQMDVRPQLETRFGLAKALAELQQPGSNSNNNQNKELHSSMQHLQAAMA
jgi:CTD small phosphatase-like protein 2